MVVLFGIAGGGKNFVGRIFEDEFGFYFYDLDSVLTDSMKDSIANRREITDDVRDEYIKAVIGKLIELSETHTKLCVAQALFKNKHRQMILDLFPDAKFVCIQAEPEIVKTRLTKRAGRDTGKHYAEIVNRNFEPTTIPHTVLTNNRGREGAASQIKQMKEVLPNFTPVIHSENESREKEQIKRLCLK